MSPFDLREALRLTQRATPESLRRNPLTAGYANTFFSLARQHGMPLARTWLLGAVILNTNPYPNASAASIELEDSLDHAAPEYHSTDAQLRRLQQHIEASSS